MKGLLIQGGRIIDPAPGIDAAGMNLLVSGGRIAWLGRGQPPEADYEVINADGLVVAPGFIDLHTHLREPGFTEKETIATGAGAAARGGFTTVCAMPNTEPPLDSESTLGFVKSTAMKDAAIRVLAIGCISLGRKGERLADMAALAQAGAVAYSDDGSPVMDSGLMRQALETGRALGLPVIDHCEDINLTRGGVMNEGALSIRLGLRGMPEAAEEIMVARDLALAALTGGHIHIAHVSTAGSVALIGRAKESGINVTAEATPHHLTLTEERVAGGNTNAKVNPPLRTARDIEALVAGLSDGTIDAVATDHAPHTDAEKRGDFTHAPFGISGLETALGSLLKLVHEGQLSLPTLIAKLTTGPANVLGGQYRELARLAAGAPADITIFDPGREWVVEPKDFASRGRNTPLAGEVLKGRVMVTIVQGKIVYEDKSVKPQEKRH